MLRLVLTGVRAYLKLTVIRTELHPDQTNTVSIALVVMIHPMHRA
jgi:hypothetical protein